MYMKKYYIFVFVIISILSPLFVSAQTAVSASTISNMGIGTTGAQVTALQKMLQTLGYFPKTVSPTEYFGSITMAAVKSFQKANGITTTGYAGPLTRQALTTNENISTPPVVPPGVVSTPPTPPTSIPPVVSTPPVVSVPPTPIPIPPVIYTPPVTPITPPVAVTPPVMCPMSIIQMCPISYISTMTNTNGCNIYSCQPATAVCNQPVDCAAPPYGCTYTGSSCGSCGTLSCTNPILPPTTTAPTVSSLNPSSAPAGTQVTITGSGFTATGNTVNFDTSVISGLSSPNSTTLTFTVPDTTHYPCEDAKIRCYIMDSLFLPGVHTVSVTNSSGTSNAITFTMTPSQATQSAPTITSLTPVSGPVGTTVTVTGSNFAPTGNIINFGIGALPGYSSSDGKTLQFNVPSTLSQNCATTVGAACPNFIQMVNGTYNVWVTNANGTSNAKTFTVTFSCAPNNLDCVPGPTPIRQTM
jgi:hypothetical protein